MTNSPFASPNHVAGARIDASGRYRIELCDGWTACSDGPEYIGFNNKTCVAGVPPVSKTYGNTVGPLLRSSGVSNKWRTWVVDVVSKKVDRTTVTIMNDFNQARCTNHYIDDYSEKKDACKGTVWAGRVHMHKFPGQWTVKPAKGGDGDCFNIVNHEKPVGCLRYLSANSDCKERHLKLAKKDDGSGLQRWKFVRVGNTPSPSPSLPGSTCVSSGPNNCAKCCKAKFENSDGSYLDDESCVDTAEYPQCTFDDDNQPASPPSPGVSPSPNPSPSPSPSRSVTIVSTFSGSPTAGKVVFAPEPGADECTVTATPNNGGPTASTTVGHPISFPKMTVTLNSLNPDTVYDVSVICKDLDGKTYTAADDKDLHTMPSNGHPGIVNLHATSPTSVEFHIVAPDASQCDPERYDVIWGRLGTAPQQLTVSQVDVSLTGLSPNTLYEISVDAVCKEGFVSKKSSPSFVTTDPTPTTPPTPPSPSTPSILDKPPTITSYTTTGPHPEVTLTLTGAVAAGATAVVDVSCSPPAGFTTSASVPASLPITTLHLPVSLPPGSTCTLTAYTESGSKTSPKANKTATTPAQAREAPSLSNWNPNYAKQAGSIDVIAPQKVDCNATGGIVEYTVSYKMSGASGAPATLSTKSPGTVTLPDNSVQYGIGQTLDITVVGECADGTKTPEGSSKMHVETCPTIPNCGTYSTSGTCTCTVCVPETTYVPSSTGYTCEACPQGKYGKAGLCVACPLPANCNVATCTSSTDSTCTQCAATYTLNGGTCAPDPCASNVAGAATGAGNVGFSTFVKFTNPADGSDMFQPGTYEVQYGTGCMKYGGTQGWTVNAQGPHYTWYIGTALKSKLPGPNNVPPGALGFQLACPLGSSRGTDCGFASYQDCVDWSKTVPPVSIIVTTPSNLGVYLVDGVNGANNFGDNVAGTTVPGGSNPSWSIKALDPANCKQGP